MIDFTRDQHGLPNFPTEGQMEAVCIKKMTQVYNSVFGKTFSKAIKQHQLKVKKEPTPEDQ